MGDTEDRPEANSTDMSWGRFRSLQGGARKYLGTFKPVEARLGAERPDRFAAVAPVSALELEPPVTAPLLKNVAALAITGEGDFMQIQQSGHMVAEMQKVGALAGRPQTQARDVFDLHHLLAIGTDADALGGLEERVLARASANALAVDFGMFKSQVLSYLPPDDQARFDSPSLWDSMVLEVVEAMGRKRS